MQVPGYCLHFYTVGAYITSHPIIRK